MSDPYFAAETIGDPYFATKTMGDCFGPKTMGDPYFTTETTGDPYFATETMGGPYFAEETTGDPYFAIATGRETPILLFKSRLTNQAWELRMEKSAEKWGPGCRRRPPVGVQGAIPPEAEAF